MTLAVVAMLPVDTTHLPRQEELPRAMPTWRKASCPGCAREAWLSPRQERVRNALRFCYYCVASLLGSGEYVINSVVDLTEGQ